MRPDGEPYATALRTITNAVGIVELRLSPNEWAREQGAALAAKFTTEQLLAHVAQTAVSLAALVREDGLP